MRSKLIGWLLMMLATCAVQSQAAGEGESLKEIKTAFVRHYAELLYAEYADSLMLARKLQTNIEIFLVHPGPENLAAARAAWTHCRGPYLQSEVGRFYDGPIESVEGFVNAWPIDENYLDYTVDALDSGIINQVASYPRITRDVVLEANAKEGEKTVSTGFHAIEFLLWGQDLYTNGPGRRSYLDYVPSRNGPGRHAQRRAEFLRLLVKLLVEQLEVVARQWAPHQPGNYRARWDALPVDQALEKILTGLGDLSGSELGGERLLVPYTTQSQENEQSCFSDTTHLGLLRNELGIQDICLGRYVRVDGSAMAGPGLISVLKIVDKKLAMKLQCQLTQTVNAFEAIPPPFDQAILGDDTAPGRQAIKKALDALDLQTTSLGKAAAVLHVPLNIK